MIRLNFWCLMFIDIVGLGLMLAMIAHSLSPERGADMILMAMPFIALPTWFVAIILLGFILTLGDQMKRWERVMGHIAIALSFSIAIPLVLLG